MNATIRDAITNAVLYLAGVCDYAQSFDGQGFNKPDSHLGHDLARRAQHRACPHFERWLDIAEVRRQAAEAEGSRERSAASPERTAEHGLQRHGQISLHGLHLRVEFPYDPELVQRVKMLRQTYGGPGFQNDASGKYWLLALAATEALTENFPQLTWTADAEAVRTRRALQRSAYVQLPPLFR
jgi:hypothetical protein